ncbi:hypothetical protein A8C56_12560 [Niabella ginsenosidivorans]|uniref:Uncharacterized protein n=1 Tax=Niabella ginsenosidivorans TaxID=1176587 RepID=A0A1A9I257_9BACT|nr:hypothetical protein [Niabella ginsenosidivorans]ANH81706.1 hypothetical protein A8C56_12560 [Niabella ginsenosidivorans]
MKIAGVDAEYFTQVFDRALKDGDRYVCLSTGDDKQPFPAETIRFFKDKSEALYYSYCKRSEENVYLETLPILSVQEQLCRKIELQQLTRSPGLELKDIIIDTAHIHYLERARREIFTEDLVKRLRDQNIKVDQKQLQDYISADFTKFQIKGMRWERDAETPYMIQIKQNESRAFLISSIRIHQTMDQQRKQEYMKNAVLTGKLTEKDAIELKNVLKAERDKGNFYAVIPAGKDQLKKEDFSFVRSVFDAWEHIGRQSSSIEGKVIIRSISLLKDEVEQQLDSKKEKEQSLEQQPEQKPPRGNDLSREK